ncbi:MAG: ABC transporter permease [Candidatus Altiarchaeota archaeon]
MIGDYFRLAIGNIRHKGIRSVLTMIGIFIGIAAVVSLISLGEGLQNAINEQFEMLGSNYVMIMPGGNWGMTSGSSKLMEKDLKLIRNVRGVSMAAGSMAKTAKLKYKDEIKYYFVIGFPTDDSQDIWLKGSGIKVIEGQKEFKPSDRYKAALGYLYAKGDVFDRPVNVGDTLYIQDQKFDVVGRISEIGNPSDDSQIYIPTQTFKDMFGIKEDEYMVIMARTKENFDPADVAEDIEKTLRRSRGLKEGEEDFQVLTTEQMKESVGTVLDTVNAILLGIAAISLIVGGIGIMNSMYTSVLERTQEIGVMKAIGAKNSDVLKLFLIESGIMGMVGGAVGIIIGVGLGKSVEYATSQTSSGALLKADISWQLIVGALAFSFIVGCVSGVMPARQASRLKPVDALRYE